MMRWTVALLAALSLSGPAELARRPFLDCTHMSKVFGEERHYRIFLPPDYESSKPAYPVIYCFHGHSDRYPRGRGSLTRTTLEPVPGELLIRDTTPDESRF